MKNETETKQKLLSSAKAEFLEKGYQKASLRNICKKADVTTGALYFFFQDKEDLFASIVEEPVNQLFAIGRQHFESELSQLEADTLDPKDKGDDMEAARMVIHYLYQYHDVFELVLTKSQGSRFEHVIDDFVEVVEQHYRTLSETFCKVKGCKPVDDYMVHWVSHMNIDAFVHLFTHEKSEEKASRYITGIVKYLVDGWIGMYEQA